MNEEIRRVSEFAKKLVAAGLFLLLLTGGAAAVLSVLAAGLNTLSTKPSLSAVHAATGPSGIAAGVSGTTGSNAQYPGSTGNHVSQGQGQAGSGGTNSTSSGVGSASHTGAVPSEQSQAVTMTSPVGQALDRGGVVVGEHVQQAFGNVLSGMIRILFLERPQASTTPQSSGNTRTSTGLQGSGTNVLQ
ncbi:hypothetical protein [Alicyclobacillus sp. SO9]|uniref:hypothetical protein n=1 Tax=Alicyclobacillus sp. SO9 TaxID=2665646 RepID=UPI0018E84DC1|nr:hypothetical protein [Alicyclobacillus sp. SO9]QQE77351.1 hypothetical protein GI364_15460 [Alicyclobacillus sp. SO9]